MPLQKEEQKVRNPSDFIKLEDGDILVIQSNVFELTSHFLQAEKTGVICGGDGCYFCEQKLSQRREFFYFGMVNGVQGVIRIPATVFYSLNGQERLIQKNVKNKGKDKRDYGWIIGKTGSGLDTEYSVSKDDVVDRLNDLEIDENNLKLVKACEKYQAGLEQKAGEIIMQDKQAEEVK